MQLSAMASPQSKRRKLRERDLHVYLIFEIRYASISPVTRYPKEYSTKDLSIQYLLQCSYQQSIYYIHRSNSLDETRLKLGIRSIPVFTKNELLDILLILGIMMDGISRSLPVRKCVKNSKSTEHSFSYIPSS